MFKYAAITLTVIVVVLAAVTYIRGPQQCSIIDVNNPVNCTCIGYEEIGAVAVVGGYESVCYGIVLK